MAAMKRYYMASKDKGRWLTLDEFRKEEKEVSNSMAAMTSFEMYLEIEKKRYEAFNLDVVQSGIDLSP